MKNAVRNIKGFLESKGIDWDGMLVDYPNKGYFKANEEIHFDGKYIVSANLHQKNGEKGILVSMLISDRYFMLFDIYRTKLKEDYSDEWINYLSKTPEAEQKRNEPLERIAHQNVHIVIEKGDNDGMAQSVKKAVFDSEELEGKSKEKFEEFKADLDADNVELI